jgi:hypothetical protein
MAKMDDEELLSLLQKKELSAGHYTFGTLGSEREEAMQAYHRQPYGNEEDGMPSVITSDVQDTVEWILPALLKIFTSTDKAVSFEPTTAADVDGAEQATDTCNYVFYKQNNGFLILYTAIKDALQVGNCAVTWRKETTELVSTLPFKGATPEMLAMLTQDGSEIIEANEAPIIDPATGQPAIDPMTGQPIMGFNGRFKKVEEKTIIKVEAFSPADLLIEDNWNSPLLAECPYSARLLTVTLSDLKQMGFKDVTVDELRLSSESQYDERERLSSPKRGVFERQDSIEDDSMVEGVLRIEYVLADIDGDGVAELTCIHRLEKRILSKEVVSHVPFATFSPVLNTHRWAGMSIHDLVGDLQKLHTEMLRQTLYNLYLTNAPRTTILTDSNGTPYADMDDFLDMRAGGAVRITRENALQPLIVPNSAGAAMPMLDYIQQMRENRTGVSRNSQGLDPDALNTTLGGKQIDQTSAMQRIELIARIVAEVLVKPMFCGVLKLLTEGGMEKLAFRLRDKFVEYDPNEWRDQYDMTINVGLGSGDAQQKMQALQMIAQNQMALLPMGLADPEKIYHTQSKMTEAAGFKDVQNFFSDPRGKPPVPPPPNPALQIEQMKQQGTAAANQFKAQQDMQTLQMTTQIQDQQHAREMQRDMEVERNKQEMQARDSQFQAQLEAQKETQRMQIEEASKQADRELARWKAELDAQVKLTIAGIKSPETLEGEEVEKVEKEDKFLQAMQMMMQQMNQPKMVVRDANGKAVGIQSVGVN